MSIYTLPLHDALPIYLIPAGREDGDMPRLDATLSNAASDPILCIDIGGSHVKAAIVGLDGRMQGDEVRVETPAGKDRKSTRLNSSHANISYAVFCLKK